MSVPVMPAGITEASHAACSKYVVGIAPVSTPVEAETSDSIQDVAISGRSAGSEVSLTRAGELMTLASSTAASSGSLLGVAA